jgi:hypothetical protein
VVEPLEERTLPSAFTLVHILHLPLPPAPAAPAVYAVAQAPALPAPPHVEVVESQPDQSHGDGPYHESVFLEWVERGESLRSAVMQLVAASAADARAASEGDRTTRAAAPPPPPAESGGDGVGPATPPPTPARDGEGRVASAVLLRGEAVEVATVPPPAADTPDGPVTSGEESHAAAPPAANDGSESPTLSARAVELLETTLPLNLPALKRGVDEFFARLDGLAEGGGGWHACTRFGPWLIVMTVGAFEAARGWRKRSRRRAAPGDEVVVGPVALLPDGE